VRCGGCRFHIVLVPPLVARLRRTQGQDRFAGIARTGRPGQSLLPHGIPHGGWCPKGRRAEDGAIPERYAWQETPSREYSQRTEWNVRDSDVTVIFTIRLELTGGSKRTAECARKHGDPCLHLAQGAAGDLAGQIERVRYSSVFSSLAKWLQGAGRSGIKVKRMSQRLPGRSLG
jgi:hypothetical protein